MSTAILTPDGREMKRTVPSDSGPAASSSEEIVIRDTSTETFQNDILERSRTQLVLVDFWAPWCGPCKQLGPILERVVTGAAGKVALFKMDIDKHPQIAGQLGIQSIPAVFAFKDGRGVDAFVGVQSEAQIKAFIEKHAGPIGPSAIELLLNEAGKALEDKDFVQASALYSQILAKEPEHIDAICGLSECYLGLNDLERARAIIGSLGPKHQSLPQVGAVKAAIEIAEKAQEVGSDVAGLLQQVKDNPDDHQARMSLALILNQQNERMQAVDQLIAIMRAEREWDDDRARKQLLEFFSLWGMTDKATAYGRRQLSALLFS